MRVYLTEKPSVAKAVAAYLGASGKRSNGFISLDNGDVVTWAIGHLLEQAPPDAYLSPEHQGKRFDPTALPIIPLIWKKFPKVERDARGKPKMRAGKPVTMPQYGVVIDLLRRASVIVNCGDVDREGQYLADELIDAAGIAPDGSSGTPVERVSVVALDERSLDRVFRAPRRSNGEAEFVRRRYAAECRSKADWLVGMNGSRAYSCAARSSVAVGRVRTAVVELVIQRDAQIDGFRSVLHFVPVVVLPGGFEMVWRERAASGDRRGFDDAGRIIERGVAQSIVSRLLQGETLEIVRAEAIERRQPPPLPHSLSALTSHMSARHGMTAQATSGAAQSLYERHKAVSYIGTDSRYLPLSMHTEAAHVLGGLGARYTELMDRVNVARRYGCWNDDKIGAHHAIIPTGVNPTALSADEARVYEAVARRFIAQFYPEYRYLALALDARSGADTFECRQTETVDPGWHVAEGSKPAEVSGEDEKDALRQTAAAGDEARA